MLKRAERPKSHTPGMRNAQAVRTTKGKSRKEKKEDDWNQLLWTQGTIDDIRKKRGGPFVPTSAHHRVVNMMVFAGIPNDRIADCLGITVDTLLKHFRWELTNALDENVSRVAERLHQIALGPDLKAALPACIFILKCRGRWRENPILDDGVVEVIKRVVLVSGPKESV